MQIIKNRCEKVACFVVFVASVVFYISCKDNKEIISEENNSQLILGFSQIGAESSWRTANTGSIYAAAERNSIQLVFDDAQQKQNNQLKAIRSFIVYQVDVIAFVPIVEDGWDNVLQEAKDAGIPVIIVDRKINTKHPEYCAGFIGEDSREEGRNAARYLLEKFKDTTGPVNILEMAGTENSSVADDRALGFREIIESDSRFNIIYSENGDFLRSRGKEITDKIIAYNGYYSIGENKIDVVYSHNDAMTLGMLESFRNNNINPKDEFVIISVDGEKEAVKELKAGNINCIVQCNPYMGDLIMESVLAASKNKTLPSETYVTEKVFSDLQDLSSLNYEGF